MFLIGLVILISGTIGISLGVKLDIFWLYILSLGITSVAYCVGHAAGLNEDC